MGVMVFYYGNMRSKTKIPVGRAAISKLLDAFFQLAEEGGDYSIIPDDQVKWYKTARINRRTFCYGVKTYDNFRAFVKEYLLRDWNLYLMNQFEVDTVKDYVCHLMRFMKVSGSANEKKQVWQEECRKEMIFAILKFSEEDWIDVVSPMEKAARAELSITASETELTQVWETWVERMRSELKKWLFRGIGEDSEKIYVRRIMYHFQKLPREIHDLVTIENELKHAELEKLKKRTGMSKGIPEYSWWYKQLEERERTEWEERNKLKKEQAS